MIEKDTYTGILRFRKEIAVNGEPHKLTPAETPKQRKKEQSDEITREIARYLAMGKKIEKVPTGKGAGNSEQNF